MTRLMGFCAAVAGILVAEFGGQQVPVFRGMAESVPVYVTVTDKASRLVTTLGREDFSIFDNGRPQPVTQFDNTPQPVHLIVMLDISGSMYGNLPLLRAACDQLFARLGPDDQARVGSFGSEIDISPTFTGDPAALRAAVPVDIPRNAPTPLWNALDAALDALKGIEGRRVVLVLSDGKNQPDFRFNRRFLTEVEIIDRAQREEVMFYGVGLWSRAAQRTMPAGGFGAPGGFGGASNLLSDMPDPGLGTLALETGGGYFEIRPKDDLGAAFARAIDELHSQYILGFAPPDRDGKRHKIEVRLGRSGLKSRARKSYIAPKAR